jgi:hypothetical protein
MSSVIGHQFLQVSPCCPHVLQQGLSLVGCLFVVFFDVMLKQIEPFQ